MTYTDGSTITYSYDNAGNIIQEQIEDGNGARTVAILIVIR